jgi:hypothetical protein
MTRTIVNKNDLDVSQVFQTFMVFGGDVGKTALAMNLSAEVVKDLATVENWAAKLAQWNNLCEGNSGDVKIEINRGVNYVQSRQLRAVLDRIITHLETKDGKQLKALLTEEGKSGGKFSARPLTDLVKAVEVCQLMTMRALGDTA